MMDLYYWTTPNGHKITIFLEEAGLPYKIIPINIGKGEQFKAEFLAISPNNRIPAIVDHEPAGGGRPISVFESGAILLYLAEKTGKFIAKDLRGRNETVEWLFWQMGSRPDGRPEQSLQHLRAGEAPLRDGPLPNEVGRLFGVMNKRLANRQFLAGDYSIADMACYPWIVPWKRQGQDIEDFPHVKRWLDAIFARDAVKRAYAKAKEVNPDPGPGGVRTAEQRAILFGQTAASVEQMAAKP